MLVREDELRLSDECQRLHVRVGPKGYPEVSYEMQKRVAKEFGFDVKIGAELLQCAETLTISKEQRDTVRYISFYRRYNRLREVPILVGQKVPQLSGPLHFLDSKLSHVHLHNLIQRSPSQPTVLLAGSYS